MKNNSSLLAILFSVFLIAGCSSTSEDGLPKKGTHHFSIEEALNSERGQLVVDPNVKLYFASGKGKVIRRGMVSNKKTNAFNKSAKEACQIAFLSAVKQFQGTAKKYGGRKVTNLVSYYKKQTYSSRTAFECEVGGLMAGVALKGNIAK